MEYVDGERASAFAQMLGGLIEANLQRPEKRRDFEALAARVGVAVTDIEEAVTLDFQRGRLAVADGLAPDRTITIHADADTVMTLSNLSIGPLGLPNYLDSTGRDVAGRLLKGRLRIEGMAHLATLNRVTRIFSVR